MKPPRGYELVEGEGGVEAFALSDATDWVASALASGRTLHDAATAESEAAGESRVLRGRGPMPIVDTPHGRWVVRHYFRGGAAAPILHDRYLRTPVPRPVSEARWAGEAIRRGIRTPRVVSGAVYPAGIFYRADLVTEYIPRSRELAEALLGPQEGDASVAFDPLIALAEAGRLLVQAAESGLYHPDMNARNILLAGDGDHVEPWLIDLDRCRFDVAGPDLVTSAMARRLERSLRKLAPDADPGMLEEWLEIFHQAVQEGGAPGVDRGSLREDDA